MASSTTVLTAISDLLLCPVCKEVYRTPRTLPCQHSMCQECLHSVISKREKPTQNDFPCPVCRSATAIPECPAHSAPAGSFPLNNLVVSMIDVVKSKEDDWPACVKHQDKTTDLVCVTHNQMVCSKCLLTVHRHCRVLDTNDYVKSSFYHSRCAEVTSILNRYQKHLRNTSHEIARKMEEISVEEEDLTYELKRLREKVFEAMRQLEQRIASKADEKRKNGMQSLVDFQVKLDTLLVDLDTSIVLMTELDGTDRSTKKLYALKSAEENIDRVDAQMAVSSVPIVAIHLQPTSMFDTAMNLLQTATDVVIQEYDYGIPPIPPPMATHPVIQEEDEEEASNESTTIKSEMIDVSLDSDGSPCDITGSVTMADDRIVFVDRNNRRLKVFDKDLQLVRVLKTEGAPFGIAAISDTEVVVTIPQNKCIQFLNLGPQDGDKATETIYTRLECWGIDFTGDKLVVATNNDGHSILYLNKTGKELSTVTLPAEDPNMRWPISVTSDLKGRLYVSCLGEGKVSGSLVVIEGKNQVQKVYTSTDLNKPCSSTLDKHGNVYVCGLASSNLLQLPVSEDKLEVLVTALYKPTHVHFIPSTNRFLLTERLSDRVSVYEMQ